MEGSGFRKLFWGFIFILIDFKINQFDILPDIIGYILILLGLLVLSEMNEYFQTAKNMSIALIVISVIIIIIHSDYRVGFIWAGIGIAMTIIDLIMVHNICQGIQYLAMDWSQDEIAIDSERAWKHYLALTIGSLCTIVLAIIPPLAFISLIGLLIYSIFVVVIITGLMSRCAEAFE